MAANVPAAAEAGASDQRYCGARDARPTPKSPLSFLNALPYSRARRPASAMKCACAENARAPACRDAGT